MDEQTRNALVMDNYGYWFRLVKRLRSTRPHLLRESMDELMQEAVLKLLEASEHWDGRKRFQVYGWRVLVNHLGHELRYRNRLVPVPSPRNHDSAGMVQNREALLEATHGDAGVGRLAAKEVRPDGSRVARIRAGMAIKKIVPHRAQYLREAYGFGSPQLTTTEMGDKYGCTRQAARDRVEHALKAVRKAVAA